MFQKNFFLSIIISSVSLNYSVNCTTTDVKRYQMAEQIVIRRIDRVQWIECDKNTCDKRGCGMIKIN